MTDSSCVVFPVDIPTVENADVCSKSKKIGSIYGSVINKQTHPINIIKKANNNIENDLYNKLEDILLLKISTFFFPLIVVIKENIISTNVFVFIPPPNEPGEAPINIRKIKIIRIGNPSSLKSIEEKPCHFAKSKYPNVKYSKSCN